MAHDKSPPPPTPSNCGFCGGNGEVECPDSGTKKRIMIRGKIGGMKSRICGECILREADGIVERAMAYRAKMENLINEPRQ